jgi:hypothetical protein
VVVYLVAKAGILLPRYGGREDGIFIDVFVRHCWSMFGCFCYVRICDVGLLQRWPLEVRKMEPLTEKQHEIIDEIIRMENETGLRLDLNTSMFICRKDPRRLYEWEQTRLYNAKCIHSYFVKGYAMAARGLLQRGIIIRDYTDPPSRYWFTTHGIEYIKGLQS